MARKQDILYAGIIGCPISHSLSPKLHRYWLKKYQIDGAYIPIEVQPKNLETFIMNISQFNIKGFNITVPHKEKAIRLVDNVSEIGRKIGAINTLFVNNDGKLSATNTDITGFLNNLNQKVPTWQKVAKKCLVLGAGGAARAVVAALDEKGVKEIILMNRTKEKAEKLSNFFGSNVIPADWKDINDVLPGVGMLVNTTTLGMINQPELLIDLSSLEPPAIVYDLVYVPNETKLLIQARKRNLLAVNGLGMLLHQAVDGFEGWYGLRPEVDINLENFILYDK